MERLGQHKRRRKEKTHNKISPQKSHVEILFKIKHKNTNKHRELILLKLSYCTPVVCRFVTTEL